MNKFMDVDLNGSLEAVLLYQNAGFYQYDFEIDKIILEKAVIPFCMMKLSLYEMIAF